MEDMKKKISENLDVIVGFLVQEKILINPYPRAYS